MEIKRDDKKMASNINHKHELDIRNFVERTKSIPIYEKGRSPIDFVVL